MYTLEVETTKGKQKETIYEIHELSFLDKLLSCKDSSKRGVHYLDIPCAFDIETTNIYEKDETGKPKKEPRPYAFMYHWQFCFDDQVVFGRRWESFQDLLKALEKNLNLNSKNRLVVWVHNLPFEWTFIKDFIEYEDGFFKDERAPLKIVTKGGIEFRCSYALSNMSLQKFCENEIDVIHYKLADTYDYEKIRTPATPMTSEDAQEVDNILRGGFDRLSLKECYSLLVIPGNVFQDKVSLLQWAKIAFKYKVMLITDHADEYSFDDLFANTEGYKDSDIELQNVIVTANWLVGRESEKLSENEKESAAFYIASSGALAGKLYDESASMAQGAGGKKYGTLDGVKGVKLDLLKSEIASLMDNQVIPMVYSEGRVMAFNNSTLYNGDNTAMKEYPIVRVFDWVKKVLMNFVHEVALENWDPYNSPKNLKSKIQAFLNDYKGYGNLFQNYEIKEPTQDPVTKRITCDISLTPFYSAKNFIIKVAADKKDKDAQMA